MIMGFVLLNTALLIGGLVELSILITRQRDMQGDLSVRMGMERFGKEQDR